MLFIRFWLRSAPRAGAVRAGASVKQKGNNKRRQSKWRIRTNRLTSVRLFSVTHFGSSSVELEPRFKGVKFALPRLQQVTRSPPPAQMRRCGVEAGRRECGALPPTSPQLTFQQKQQNSRITGINICVIKSCNKNPLYKSWRHAPRSAFT